jgi:hypothetical protein
LGSLLFYTCGYFSMTDSSSFLEILWDALLSRDPSQIRAAYSDLDSSSQKVVLTHLQRMVQEDGWHPEQVKSALVALNALEQQTGNAL